MTPLITTLRAAGFTDADPALLSDKPIRELVFLTRAHGGVHQYASLCHYEGRFLEAVIEICARPRALRPKDRWANVAASACIRRSAAEVLTAVGSAEVGVLNPT